MNASALLLALLAGFLSGLVYFACLWLSVRSLTGARRWRAFAAGSVARFAAVVALLALVLWQRIEPALILPGLLGFLAARFAVTVRGRHGIRSGER